MEIFKSRKPRMTFGIKDEMPSAKVSGTQMPVMEKKGEITTPKVLKQTGMVKDPLRDASRKALLPGKRISKTGKVYWETRKNRSDAFRSNL